MIKTYKISVSGQVQGVGFRPHVYLLAIEFSLKGTVSNNEKGVIIFVSGEDENIQNFYNKLINFPPPVSKIQDSYIEEIEVRNFEDFRIIPSEKEGQLNLPLTPDFAICKDCENELKDSTNRRVDYAFTTCVNCGPRWSITQTFPFERAQTSIDDFPMCEDCVKEYTNPADRRFHSQTNTCETCGIQLKLVNNLGEKIQVDNSELFEKVANLLSQGKIIAIKNTSGYLLCCNSENSEVVQQLRTKKHRPNKPFAVLYPSLKFLQNEVELNKKQINSLQSSERPINIISLNNYKGNIALKSVAPNLNQLGVLLPYTGILQLLANKLEFPIVATSGNIHGSPIISKIDDSLTKLKDVADYFLQHNLKIEHPQDDSVLKYSTKFQQEVLFRRSRGFAPNYLNIKVNSTEKILAMGAHLKSTIAFYPNENLYVSQYLGNLDDFDVYNRFTETSEGFIQLFEQKPEVILVDKHPLYQSTQYGKELAEKHNAKLIEVQHHKAHFTSIIGEYNLWGERVLGVVFDGTGYGDDKNIWGGDFFKYENNSIERIAQVENFDWLLGDKMSKEPRVSLFALASEEMKPILEEKFSPSEIKNYTYLKSQNKLKTSSVGRLFDAVASLLNITDYNTYEGEAAILLENSISDYNLSNCKLYCKVSSNGFSAKEIIINIYKDVKKEIPKEEIICNFLYTLTTSIINFADKKGFKNVAFSGGVFQNTTLVDMLLELAPKELKLYFHKELSPNDENVSFGQIMHYLHIKE
ncbi:carbamoyltransferase HypF [uncultured Lutibacter sp.]|uniref:carbamoyltransferase HypF n=1 Tax=uncultured Lutibacter sp. TaxID=437739 RepID=UPI002637141C|nr:carbamoyltransferase HypF [uncultured Lutibacter sp.]